MRKTRTQLIVAAAIGVILLILLGYYMPWTGFDAYTPIKMGDVEVQREKTLWDWLGLLIIPLVLAGGGLLFSRAERKSDREIADQRVKEEREIASDRLRDAALREYLDRMSDLLLVQKLDLSEEQDPVRNVARARTLTILRTLQSDGHRKGNVVQFLYEVGLIKAAKPVVGLAGAYLAGADLEDVDLAEANLAEAHLTRANLTGANLAKANLAETNLSKAFMYFADLSGADLSGAGLRATGLVGANLAEAILNGADLSGADLSGATITVGQLAQAKSLEGAIMPDGSVHD